MVRDRGTAAAEGAQGRTARAGRRGRARHVEQRPFRQPRLGYPALKAVSDDALEAIHEASLTILEEIGIDFLNPAAKTILKDAGADVDAASDRVRLDRALVLEAIGTCPSEFTLHARNSDHDIRFGGDWIAFAQMASAPNCADSERGRRPGSQADFRELIKLGQCFNVIHLTGGYPVEPVDVHSSIRHLECLRDFATLTNKVFHCYSLGRERNLDAMEIARIARGISAEQFEREPSILSIINSSSPLRLDNPMLQGIIEMSSRNQVIVVTPFTLAGAMAPVTLPGALAQQNAEALAGLAFAQLVRPGAPVVYGGFTSNVDMKSGAPAFGTPEYMKAAIIGGQLARRYGLPYRTSNACAANAVDAQAGYESVFSLWGAIMGGGNFIKHAAGWMEGGLCFSYEKFMVDVDLLQMVTAFLDQVTVDESTLALDAVREVGPGGHFFGAEHTQARYRDAFYAPLISDWRNFETWQEAGSPSAADKAGTLWKEALANYEQPPLDPAIAEELDAFVERRKAEGGAPTDF